MLSYIPDHDSVHTALSALVHALRTGGILAIDLCGLGWHTVNHGRSAKARLARDWAMITMFRAPTKDRFSFEHTVFTQRPDGTWRSDDERHDLVLTDAAQIPSWFAETGFELAIGDSFGGSFGGETLPSRWPQLGVVPECDGHDEASRVEPCAQAGADSSARESAADGSSRRPCLRSHAVGAAGTGPQCDVELVRQ